MEEIAENGLFDVEALTGGKNCRFIEFQKKALTFARAQFIKMLIKLKA